MHLLKFSLSNHTYFNNSYSIYTRHTHPSHLTCLLTNLPTCLLLSPGLFHHHYYCYVSLFASWSISHTYDSLTYEDWRAGEKYGYGIIIHSSDVTSFPLPNIIQKFLSFIMCSFGVVECPIMLVSPLTSIADMASLYIFSCIGIFDMHDQRCFRMEWRTHTCRLTSCLYSCRTCQRPILLSLSGLRCHSSSHTRPSYPHFLVVPEGIWHFLLPCIVTSPYIRKSIYYFLSVFTYSATHVPQRHVIIAVFGVYSGPLHHPTENDPL